MKRILNLVTVLCILVWSSMSLADLPKSISDGFEIYKDSGIEAAVERWRAGSHWANGRVLRKVVSERSEFELTRGAYQGYELFRAVSIGPRVSVYFILAYFEKSVLFIRFHTYRKSSGEVIVLRMDFESDVEKKWPTTLLYEN